MSNYDDLETEITRTEGELGWNDVIENDSPEFVILPDGDYNFEVVDFERGRHNGSEKLPPCNKAIVHIRIEGIIGIVTGKQIGRAHV